MVKQGILEEEVKKDVGDQLEPAIDYYTSFIAGHEGEFHRNRVIPKGYSDEEVQELHALVLKPDGDFFNERFARIGSGTTKGDMEAPRTCLLRYFLKLFPRARIIDSAGTDASFHIVIPVDETVSRLLSNDRERLMGLLRQLRLIGFCDKIGDGLLSALSARKAGSINSKTGRTVALVHPGDDAPYGLEELEALVGRWFKNPVNVVFRAWFGIESDERTRCPFHDSADPDLLISPEASDGGIACCGQYHCAKGGKVAAATMTTNTTGRPALTKLLMTGAYRERWEKQYREVSSHVRTEANKAALVETAESSGKTSLHISSDTTEDQIGAIIRDAFIRAANIYCRPDGTLVSIDKDVAGTAYVEHVYDDTSKLMALVSRVCVVSIQTAHGSKICPLPRERANVQLYNPDLRVGLKILRRISKAPVLDIPSARVLPPGYDARTGIFYDGVAIEPRLDATTPVLDQLLSGWTGFCNSTHRSCRDDRAIAHLYSTVMTEILADTGLFTIHRHPLFRGNQKGVGKDKMSEILGILRDGRTPVDLEHEDDNRINQGFGNGLVEGRRIFQFTNIETNRPYANTMLTRWSTAESLTGAKHGGGKWEINPNTASFVLTLNRGTIDPDLLDRLLVVDLEVAGDARERKFAIDPIKFMLERRLEILSEVFGLAILSLRGETWELPENTDIRFERWMRVIGTMLHRRGLPGFMSNLEEVEAELDEDRDAFEELANRVWNKHQDAWLQAKDILALCKSGDPLFEKQTVSKKPERELSRNVLKPRIGKQAGIKNGTSSQLRVELQHRENKKTKNSDYRLVLVSENGGDGGDAKADHRLSSPPHKPLINKDVIEFGGDGGDNSKRVSNTIDKGSSSIYFHITKPAENNPPITAITAITAIPVISNDPELESDPWKGNTV